MHDRQRKSILCNEPYVGRMSAIRELMLYVAIRKLGQNLFYDYTYSFP